MLFPFPAFDPYRMELPKWRQTFVERKARGKPARETDLEASLGSP